MTLVNRWKFVDPATLDEFTFPHNPFSMDSPNLPHKTVTMPGLRRQLAFRQGRAPKTWSFRGRIYTEGFYASLQDWSQRDTIHITDHRLRVHDVIPLAFEPTPKRTSTRDLSWRFDYVFKCVYVGRVS